MQCMHIITVTHLAIHAIHRHACNILVCKYMNSHCISAIHAYTCTYMHLYACITPHSKLEMARDVHEIVIHPDYTVRRFCTLKSSVSPWWLVLIEKKTVKTSKTNKPKKTQLIVEDDDYDYYDEYDENYLQKFDNDLIKTYVSEFHPECLNHNNEEILKLSVVTRNDDGIIIDPLHRTIPFLTKYEKTRILGQRSKQIESGAKPLVKVPENVIDSYIIAELELREKKIPFVIRRPIPGGACEYWNIRDLEFIGF